MAPLELANEFRLLSCLLEIEIDKQSAPRQKASWKEVDDVLRIRLSNFARNLEREIHAELLKVRNG